MYKRVKLKKLGRKRSHRVSLLQNQIRTLFENGVLRTTTVKAKAVRSVTQSVLSDLDSKDIDLATRRKLKKVLGNNELIEKALRYVKEEEYGVRIRKIGFRSGDNAEVSRVELIGFEGKRKRKGIDKKEKEEKKQTKTSKVGRKANKDIEERNMKKSSSGKSSKAQRKSTQRVRTRAGL